MNTTSTTINIERLKREAKKIHKETGMTHVQALDHLAAKFGFAKWSLLMKHHSSSKTS